MSTTTVALVPRDGFFCKDGRGWHTSASNRGHALRWPWPSTVLGALRSAWGRNEEARLGSAFGPDDWRTRTAFIGIGRTVALRRPRDRSGWDAADRVWPAPSDAVALEGVERLHRLEPEPPRLPTVGRDDDDAREALWTPSVDTLQKPLPARPWWSEQRFVSWLAGRSPLPARDPEHEFDLERRVQAHVRIRPDTGTAADSALFSHDVVETIERDGIWGVGVEVTLPSDALPAYGTLGSDSRLVRLEPVSEDALACPDGVSDAFAGGSAGLRLLAVTPTCFANGWIPDGFHREGREYRGRLPGVDADLVLRAAFVPRSIAVSGWDMVAKQPKPVARMVAPGAVYFFVRRDGGTFGRAEARALWLAALGARTDEGFGRVVPGVWTPTIER